MLKICDRCKKELGKGQKQSKKTCVTPEIKFILNNFTLCEDCLKKFQVWFLRGENERYWQEVKDKMSFFCQKYITKQCIGCPIKQYKISKNIVMACNKFTEKYPEIVKGLKEDIGCKNKVLSKNKKRRRKNYDRSKKIHL